MSEPVRIVLVPYDPSWPARFAEHDARIRTALGDVALAVEHVGSTSVPGLAAKPIVDVLVVVPDSTDEAAYVPALEAAGYVFGFREPELEEHRFLQPSAGGANVHVYGPGADDIEELLLFRNRLRDSSADRTQYETTKRALSEHGWPTVQDYADAKTDVVHEIIGRARQAAADLTDRSQNAQGSGRVRG